MVWLFATQSFIQIRLTVAELQKSQKYGNPELLKSNLSLGFPWYGYSPPKVSSKLGSLLQSYSIEKHMATLNKKSKGIVQGPTTTGPTRTWI